MGKKSAVKGGIFGVVVGAIAGVLFAPKSGKKTRDDIKKTAAKVNKEAEKKLKEVHAELKEKAEEAKKLADEYSGKAKEEYEDLAKRAEFAKTKVSELIAAVRDFEADDSEVDEAVNEGKKVVGDIKKKSSAKKSAKK